MDHKKIIFIGVIILGILSLFIILDYKKKGGLGGQTISANILYLTSPVNSLSGKVEKIEGNAVLISSQYAVLQTAPIAITVMPNQPPVMPTPQVKTITYKLLITEKTQISQPASNINYLFKTAPPPSALDVPTASVPKLTIKNIRVGQYITANSQEDLRTLQKNTFEATLINLPPITNTLNGKIVNVANNTLTLKAFVPVMAIPNAAIAVDIAPPTPQEKEYVLYITPDTEISRNVYGGNNIVPGGESPKPEKLTLSDLKVDTQATVYTAEDIIYSQTLTAMRIEPAASTSPLIAP